MEEKNNPIHIHGEGYEFPSEELVEIEEMLDERFSESIQRAWRKYKNTLKNLKD